MSHCPRRLCESLSAMQDLIIECIKGCYDRQKNTRHIPAGASVGVLATRCVVGANPVRSRRGVIPKGVTTPPESLNDVCFLVAPIEMYDVLEMMNEIKDHRILDAVDREAPGKSLMALGTIGLEHKQIREIDVNPMIVRGSLPVAADALVVLRKEEYP